MLRQHRGQMRAGTTPQIALLGNVDFAGSIEYPPIFEPVLVAQFRSLPGTIPPNPNSGCIPEQWVRQLNGCNLLLVCTSCRAEAAVEGDLEGVEGGLRAP
jgi:hypothetical protein